MELVSSNRADSSVQFSSGFQFRVNLENGVYHTYIAKLFETTGASSTAFFHRESSEVATRRGVCSCRIPTIYIPDGNRSAYTRTIYGFSNDLPVLSKRWEKVERLEAARDAGADSLAREETTKERVQGWLMQF